MNRHLRPSRVIAGTLALAALGLALAACGREHKILTPASESTATWTGTVSHLFADRSEGTRPTGCTSCHHPDTALPDYTNYDSVYVHRVAIHDRLADPNDTMRKFLAAGEADVIVNWVTAGAPK
jgi:hypothetical protein